MLPLVHWTFTDDEVKHQMLQCEGYLSTIYMVKTSTSADTEIDIQLLTQMPANSNIGLIILCIPTKNTTINITSMFTTLLQLYKVC